jgi:predicted ester cyclase
MSEESKAMVQRIVDEMNKGNLDVLDEYYAPDYLHHQPPFPDIKGLAAFKRFSANMRASFPDFQQTIEDEFVEGNKGVVRITAMGTHTGQSKAFPFPPTGKKVTWTGCLVTRTAGGKVVEGWNYFDNLGLLQQFGIIPSV